MLKEFGLANQVFEPTIISGNILDLVATNEENHVRCRVDKNFVSDHYCVIFSFTTEKYIPKKKEAKVFKWAKVNTDFFVHNCFEQLELEILKLNLDSYESEELLINDVFNQL